MCEWVFFLSFRMKLMNGQKWTGSWKIMDSTSLSYCIHQMWLSWQVPFLIRNDLICFVVQYVNGVTVRLSADFFLLNRDSFKRESINSSICQPTGTQIISQIQTKHHMLSLQLWWHFSYVKQVLFWEILELNEREFFFLFSILINFKCPWIKNLLLYSVSKRLVPLDVFLGFFFNQMFW